MSLKVIKHAETVEILEGDIPFHTPVRLYTEDEMNALRAWQALPGETRDDMMQQAQSASYREWMKESEWDQILLREEPGNELSLDDFKP